MAIAVDGARKRKGDQGESGAFRHALPMSYDTNSWSSVMAVSAQRSPVPGANRAER